MSQTLLTNKKLGKNTDYAPVLSRPSFAFTGRNMFISIKKPEKPLERLKTSCDSYLGLGLSKCIG
jgi:hypothetical protein